MPRAIAAAILVLLLGGGTSQAQTFTLQPDSVFDNLLVTAVSISLGDIDGDGDLDVMVQGVPNSRRMMRSTFVGTGVLDFTNVTNTLGPLVGGNDTGWSAAWADYDGDGDVDIFLGQSNLGTNRGDLFRNDGAAGFLDVSASTIDEPGFHQNIAWNDIDLDGDLDLIFGMEGPEMHEIYRQNADGSFTPIGAEVGLHVPYGTKSYGMAVGDYDGDGDCDIYISTCILNSGIRNNFFENRLIPDGHLHFVDIADENGTQYMNNSYGTEFVDLDNDGDLDLYVTGADGYATKIWRNNGDKTWTDVDTLLGHPVIGQNGTDRNGSKAVDYDNDGDLDLYFHDHVAGNPNRARWLYRNDGGWVFTEVGASVGLGGTNEGGYDSAWGDLDLDGDMDLVTATASNRQERIFLNSASAQGNHWLQVRLKGPRGNTTGIGASLYATIHTGTPQEMTIRREANTNASTFNQSDIPVHFGLGATSVVDRLRIVWPNGVEQILTDLPTKQYLTVEYPLASTWSIQ